MAGFGSWNIPESNENDSLTLDNLKIENLKNELILRGDLNLDQNNDQNVNTEAMPIQVLSLFSAVNSALTNVEKTETGSRHVQAKLEDDPKGHFFNSLSHIQMNEQSRKRKNMEDENVSENSINDLISKNIELLCQNNLNQGADLWLNDASKGMKDGRSQMIKISCRHASVIQKSYGSEKRFLCPPPVLMIDGPFQSLLGLSFRVEISIMNEEGQYSQAISEIYNNQQCMVFRSLHVSSLAAAKSKILRLSIDFVSTVTDQRVSHLVTSPIDVVSKPAKKGTKSKVSHITLRSGSVISLYNRINSQTVRTKYTTLENRQFCLRSDGWAPLRIHLISSSPESTTEGILNNSVEAVPIRYGSVIQLQDEFSEIMSDPLIIRRVEKDGIAQDDGYVNQMHRIVLESSASFSTNLALGYENARSGFMPADRTQPRWFLGATSAQCKNLPNEAVVPVEWEPIETYNDEVLKIRDSVCWTIVGISQCDCTILRPVQSQFALRHLDLPCVEAPPIYLPSNQSLELSIEGFSPDIQIWLGNIGPLNYTKIEKAEKSLSRSVTILVSLIQLSTEAITCETLPLLFVFPDGTIVSGRCDISLSPWLSLGK
ncbi:CBF1/Su(H)/LAG-1 family transcription factor Cbf11 [Schizosaccharomyces cryophilus OY26]|uniref:CBF1/Su(H)/LAG-1 family transcription factor Cbf11 n=1 Tax=Schizosaccharomyces cryophilus (strain OY26 / ATCC MYA-4695 / CBS 11777 / NBRC 106824 / NRRL Y48691) TaxID=653667 RepID=S9VVB3_SCHCR|nr:CBF1/Su(H)/LAG-1 family transcription factor Cbf11 [Schizosaccharomyces cryophilus OY26]EPY50020.1 CBF1/Su(H)/LAG-1 family transcription factor Cbf11 [Schizosaccharomyces cryophilus OY26]